MLISTSDGISSHIIRAKDYHRETSFQWVGTGADIAFEVPSADFEPGAIDDYAGAWTALTYDGAAVVLNANTNHVTIYGSLVFRVSKGTADGAGVAWVW